MIQFRTLTASEIECRISTVKANGISLLLYKDARCDMNILDETVGTENWQRTHELINGSLFCNVGINIHYQDCTANPVWVWKQDVGTESYTEKEKGQASDSFKRACFNWGIGRELYTAPFIWISSEDCEIKESGKQDARGNKVLTCYDKFYVEQILYEGKKIVTLSIKNAKSHKRVFLMDNRKKEQKGICASEAGTTAGAEGFDQRLELVKKELQRIGYAPVSVCRLYNISDIRNMTEEMIRDFLKKVKEVPDRKVG